MYIPTSVSVDNTYYCLLCRSPYVYILYLLVPYFLSYYCKFKLYKERNTHFCNFELGVLTLKVKHFYICHLQIQ